MDAANLKDIPRIVDVEGRSYMTTYNAGTGSDTTLVSSDNIHFKVKPSVLEVHSIVFRDTLIGIDLTKSSPIPINATATDLELLLDLMKSDYRLSNKLGWRQLDSILRLCDQYELTFVVERVKPNLWTFAKTDPWEVFCVASHLDDVDLAKKAIVNMDAKVTPELSLHSIALETARGPTLAYLLGLLRLAHPLEKIMRQGGERLDCVRVIPSNWEREADSFSPLRSRSS
ncbi:hypothetical protein IAU60_000470 [Kwoniella sp. DSM 27419]